MNATVERTTCPDLLGDADGPPVLTLDFKQDGFDQLPDGIFEGSSRMRGVPYGEFDHIVWVTMKKDGPLLANINSVFLRPTDFSALK